ncbi:MAG: PAS domain-containing protein [Spirochaetaceae bacterium]|jgi:predicted transcriptional regulator YheO|nr:PAS domain-containing protein [Spirochaetaceae bacterium]
MEKKHSRADALILESYKMVVEGLAAYFGDAFEFVLHDLIDLDHSLTKILHGSHSGRKEGAPITDFALSMLEKIKAQNDNEKPYAVYFSQSKYGKPVRSTTIVIHGEHKKPIGLLCVNLYLDSPITSLLENFSLGRTADYITENFSQDSGDLIIRALARVKDEVYADASIHEHLKNKEIVTLLYHQGIFKLKNAVQTVSKELRISKNTVYLHIRALE